MRKTFALILAGVGLIVAVGLPIVIASLFNIDLGAKPGLGVGGMMPGLGIMVLARRLWKGATTPRPLPGPIPPGHLMCVLCGTVVEQTDGVDRRLDLQTPMARVGFVCHACNRYRTKRALLILVLFLAGLGVFALIVQLTVPKKK